MHAKSQCIPSSRLINSLLKQSPGIRPRFFSQKIAQKDPEKNMPSTAANAIMQAGTTQPFRTALVRMAISSSLDMSAATPRGGAGGRLARTAVQAAEAARLGLPAASLHAAAVAAIRAGAPPAKKRRVKG